MKGLLFKLVGPGYDGNGKVVSATGGKMNLNGYARQYQGRQYQA